MGKTLKSWSGMRKYLEKDMLAESLQGKVRYNCTAYTGMDGCHIFEIYLNDKLFRQFSWETVNSYFIKLGYVKKTSPMSIRDYWDDFWKLIDRYPINERTEYTDNEFADALEKYRNSDLQECLRSENPIVKMFALLDRRTGKRTLERLAETIKNEPEWIQKIYAFRLNA